MTMRSIASLLIFAVGLVAAAASGVATYRAVGLYGGPVQTGFHREWDPVAGQHRLIHETTTKSGVHIRRLLSDDLKVLRMETSGAPVGPALEKTLGAGGTRIGFSTARDGVIDAWSIRDPRGETTRIEVSTKRNGTVDRWEQYAKGQLIRVDLDTDGNGKADRWMTYEGGILMDTFIDADEDGQPDGPPER